VETTELSTTHTHTHTIYIYIYVTNALASIVHDNRHTVLHLRLFIWSMFCYSTMHTTVLLLLIRRILLKPFEKFSDIFFCVFNKISVRRSIWYANFPHAMEYLVLYIYIYIYIYIYMLTMTNMNMLGKFCLAVDWQKDRDSFSQKAAARIAPLQI